MEIQHGQYKQKYTLQAIRHGESIITTISFYLLKKFTKKINKHVKLLEKYLSLRHKQQNKNHILLTSHKNYHGSWKSEAAIK